MFLSKSQRLRCWWIAGYLLQLTGFSVMCSRTSAEFRSRRGPEMVVVRLRRRTSRSRRRRRWWRWRRRRRRRRRWTTRSWRISNKRRRRRHIKGQLCEQRRSHHVDDCGCSVISVIRDVRVVVTDVELWRKTTEDDRWRLRGRGRRSRRSGSHTPCRPTCRYQTTRLAPSFHVVEAAGRRGRAGTGNPQHLIVDTR